MLPEPAGRRRPHPRPAGAPPRRRRARRARACPRCGARRSSGPTATPRSASTPRPRRARTRAPREPALRRAAPHAHPPARHDGRRAAAQRRPGHPRRRALRARARRRARRARRVRRPPRTSASARPTRPLAAIRAAVPPQPRHVGLLLAGDRERAGWWGDGRPADVADVVEVARTARRGARRRARGGGGCRRARSTPAAAPASRWPTAPSSATSASCTPRWSRPSGCRPAPWAVELDLDVLTIGVRGDRAGPHARHLPDGAERRRRRRRRGACPPTPCSARCATARGSTWSRSTLFDVYRGDQVGDGRKSLAYRLTFRAPDRTLTTDEVSALRDTALRAAADAVGAVQRA